MNIYALRLFPVLLGGMLTVAATGAGDVERQTTSPRRMPSAVTVCPETASVLSDRGKVTLAAGPENSYRDHDRMVQANPLMKAPESGTGGPPPPDDPKMLQWLYRKLERYLQIEKNQSARFEPIFLEFAASRGRLMRENSVLLRKIVADVENQSVPVKDIQKLSKKYQDIDHQLMSERELFYKKSGKILNKRQMVKLIIYEDKVKEDLFHRMRRGRNSSEQGRESITPQLFGNPAPGK